MPNPNRVAVVISGPPNGGKTTFAYNLFPDKVINFSDALYDAYKMLGIYQPSRPLLQELGALVNSAHKQGVGVAALAIERVNVLKDFVVFAGVANYDELQLLRRHCRTRGVDLIHVDVSAYAANEAEQTPVKAGEFFHNDTRVNLAYRADFVNPTTADVLHHIDSVAF